MKPICPCVLTINGGSSSIKFAFYGIGQTPERGLFGKVERIGLEGTNLTFEDPFRDQGGSINIGPSLHRSVADTLVDWLEDREDFESIAAVGHRVVHGMQHTGPSIVTQNLLEELHRTSPYDPEHLPREIELIEAILKRHPRIPQVACFDTVFHCEMPQVAKMLPIPRRYAAKGVRRYGFHGLSYTYLMEDLGHRDPDAAGGRVILAHLGNGASMAAVRKGKSIDTSMSFTPAAGLPMSTRSGDLDPGLSGYFARTEGMDAAQFNQMVNHESGLLGVSGISSDMRDLLAKESTDEHAAEAVELFCYQAKKWIGAFTAVLGGLDTLVFAGGIGENVPLIRSRICKGLGFLGIELNSSRNSESAALISEDETEVKVRIIRTNEELMIARSVCQLVKVVP